MNIMEVAHRAQVSTATVSRVINGTAFVTPETAERVRQAIEDLNFYPDTNARTLGSGRSSLFGLIISDITNPYFPELVKAFEDIAVAHGKEVLIANTNYDPVRMELCVVRMLQRKVDGVAILTSEMDEQLIRNFSRRRIPLVFMDTAINLPTPGSNGSTPAGNGSDGNGLPSGSTGSTAGSTHAHAGTVGSNVSIIRVNYEAGVRAAMDHLLGLGHRDLGFLSGPLTLSSARVRLESFHAALARHGLTPNPAWIEVGDHRVEGGRHAMQRILSRPTRPTAVLASNDLTAIGAIGAIHEHGLRIPQDISVMGFDGIELSAYVQPGLTTMLVPREELSAIAFRSLLQHQQESERSAVTPERSAMTPDRSAGTSNRSATIPSRSATTPNRTPRLPGTTTGPHEHIVEPHLLTRGSTAPPSHSTKTTPSA